MAHGKWSLVVFVVLIVVVLIVVFVVLMLLKQLNHQGRRHKSFKAPLRTNFPRIYENVFDGPPTRSNLTLDKFSLTNEKGQISFLHGNVTILIKMAK